MLQAHLAPRAEKPPETLQAHLAARAEETLETHQAHPAASANSNSLRGPRRSRQVRRRLLQDREARGVGREPGARSAG
jgi:hypothetical protein